MVPERCFSASSVIDDILQCSWQEAIHVSYGLAGM